MANTNNREAEQCTVERKNFIDTVTDKAQELATDAAGAAGTAVDKAKEMAATVKEKVTGMAAVASAYAGEASDKVQEWTAKATHETEAAVQNLGKELTSLVRRYPIQSLLAGLAVGFLLARVTKRS
jgi:hypothetical protein